MGKIQSNRRNDQMPRPQKRRFGGFTGQTPQRSGESGADGFLRQRFYPVIPAGIASDWKERERFFFDSVRNLEQAEGISCKSVSGQPYPLNIFEAYADLHQQLEERRTERELFIVRCGRYPYCMAMATPMETGYTLYYLPLQPLFRLSRVGHAKKEVALIRSAYCYLHQIVGMGSDFTDGMLDMMLDNYEQEDDQSDPWAASCIRSLRSAIYGSDKVKNSFRNRTNLLRWKSRLDSYVPGNDSQKTFLKSVTMLYRLYRRFPGNGFFDSICPQYKPQYDTKMCADEYFSFVWTNEGWMADEILDYVNGSFGDYELLEQPLKFTVYDRPGGRPADNTRFERELLQILEELVCNIENLSI